MIRKQIVIDAEREELLARLAERRGVSQSELIREAIDDMAAKAAAQDEKREAFNWLMAFFEEGRPLGTIDEQGRRTWTREDLYGDRGSGRH